MVDDFMFFFGDKFLFSFVCSLAGRTLSLDLKNAWEISEKFNAERQSREATNASFSESTNWRRGWDSSSIVPPLRDSVGPRVFAEHPSNPTAHTQSINFTPQGGKIS